MANKIVLDKQDVQITLQTGILALLAVHVGANPDPAALGLAGAVGAVTFAFLTVFNTVRRKA